MQRRETSLLLLISILTTISAILPTSSHHRVPMTHGKYISSLSKIRRPHVLSSLAEKEVGSNAFKPSATFGRILSNHHNYNSTTTAFAPRETHVKNLAIGTSTAEILAEPPKVIELFSVIPSNSSNTNTTDSEEINSIGSKGRSAARAKGSRFYYGEVQATSNEHSQTNHGNAHSESHTGLFFPEDINELTTTHYEHPHAQSHNTNNDQRQYYHAQYPVDYNTVHHGEHVLHEPPVYYSGLRQAHSNSGLSSAVSKALKFWLPTALVLTGASVLFPQRVRVATNANDRLNNRSKRSTHFLYTTGRSINSRENNFEIIPALSLPLPQQYRDEDKAIEDYAEEVALTQYSESKRRSKSLNSSVSSQEIPEYYEPRKISELTKKILNQTYPIVPRSEQPRPIVTVSTSTIPNVDLRYQKEEAQDANIPLKKFTSPSPQKPKQSRRKIRVLLRSRKNNLTSIISGTPSSSLQHEHTEAFKPKTDRLSTIVEEVTPEQPELARSVSNVKKTSNLISSSSIISEVTAPNIGALFSKNTTKSSKNLPSNSFHGDPDLLQLLNENILLSTVATKIPFKAMPSSEKSPTNYDLSPQGPVIGLLSSTLRHENESEACQKKALCELAIRGTNPTATKFETFMWTLATLVPDAFTILYDLGDTFQAIRDKQCSRFLCAYPNLDIQE